MITNWLFSQRDQLFTFQKFFRIEILMYSYTLRDKSLCGAIG